MTHDSLQESIHATLAHRRQQGRSPILLMAHLVLGHPSLAENRQVIRQMARAGVEIIELQIPFSEPIADGPVIARANQLSLDRGFRVAEGMALLAEVSRQYPSISFLLMTYYNILFARGEAAFVARAAAAGARGLIIPDLPLEEAGPAIQECDQAGLAWIQLMTPTTPPDRLALLGAAGRGFCYCVARKGVTGRETDFGGPVRAFLQHCRNATPVPLAVGFGVKQAEDVAFLADLAAIAVVGSEAIRVHETRGAEAVGDFFTALRPD